MKELPVRLFKTDEAWNAWLKKNHSASSGLWVRFAKKAAKLKSVTYQDALDIALCYGWIDGQRKSLDEESWLQKFTPRGSRSIWSKINKTKALDLIERGLMQQAGHATIERERANGQWEAAYDSYRTSTVPDDFEAALARKPKARKFFATLGSQNRYAILFRLQTARTQEIRERRIEQFIEMLIKGEALH